jgi:hypothetical protein
VPRTLRGGIALLLLGTACATPALAQGVRERMRPKVNAITASQATDLTLTLTSVAVRPVQVWVRTAGLIDSAGKTLAVTVAGPDAAMVKVGQRARVFPVESRSSMFQARVVRTSAQSGGLKADLELTATSHAGSRSFVVEIVTEPGDYLSVPTEAIIEEGESRVVYVQTGEGQFEPRTITTGIQGERYTQVTGGVKDGDQVVSFGSFFIDADYKLKGAAQVVR